MNLIRARGVGRAVFTTACLCFLTAYGAQARELSFDERVAAQRAVEQVYWNHRSWPKENPAPKPPLASVMSDEAIRAKVDEYLRKSNALARWWQHPITTDQLQAELDRMAAKTRDPELLRELQRALGDDPFVIAQTLGRQTLVDRLIRSWYSSEARFHAATKANAEAALAACASVECMKSMGAEFRSTTWKLRSAGLDPSKELKSDGVVYIDPDEFKNLRDHWVQLLGGHAMSLPLDRLSGVEETAEAFTVMAVRADHDGEITTWSVSWPKRSFDSWWSAERPGTSPEIAVSDAVYVLAAPASNTCTNDTWAETIDEPAARALHTAVWTGSEMIIWGGYSDGAVNSGGRYNPSTDSWTPTSQGGNVPSARFSHAAFWSGTKMIVWGGNFGGATGGRYDPGTDSWLPTSTGANTPTARLDNAAVWTGIEMIIWGGGTYSNTGARYNPSTDSWTPTSQGANVPSIRNNPWAIWTGTEMIIFSGQDSGGWLNSGGRYNPSTNTWASMTPALPTLFFLPFGPPVWTGSQMIIWGEGGHGGRYNSATNAWTPTSEGASMPSGRYGHSTAWIGPDMLVWGGVDSGGVTNTGGRYNPSTDSWTAIPVVANTPSARYRHTTVWNGSELIVWGGTPCTSCGLTVGNFFSSGGRYNPATNIWIPTHTKTGVPSQRTENVAVWTGSEMIVWGGSRAGNYLNTGGRYTPATDSWTAISVVPSTPSGRSRHTAIWTGEEMLVWGGDGNIGFLNTGGRYNPSADSWTATSTGPNTPSGRDAHSAVWTGTDMIVWGGYDGSFLDTGARYNLATNGWTATSVVPPSLFPRSQHSAVWTGSEMIVWGGIRVSTFLNSGGRYNPSTDNWSLTSMGADVPLPRRASTAAWTGAQMIIWGGHGPIPPNSWTNTGGRYDPSTDSWSPTSTGVNLPDGRATNAGVWTGSELIIWGGYNGFNDVDTGGRYNPSTDTWTPTSAGANVPVPRENARAVWTGTQMIVWGGDTVEVNPGVYCACPSGRIVYRDADADGYGNPAESIPACDGSIPAGYAANGTDCNDANANLHPGAAETCNGLDDNCDGTVDNGASGLCSDSDACTDDFCNGLSGCSHAFNNGPCDDGLLCTNGDTCNAGVCAGVVGPPPEIGDFAASGHETTTLSWTGLSGATTYDLASSSLADLQTNATFGATCLANDVPGTSVVDPQPNPGPGAGYYYLIRAQNVCGVGGFGFDSAHVARTPTAACP